MITFNPGPSQISSETKQDIIDLVNTNILETSHRSQVFSDISGQAIEGLKQFLQIPEGYTILYTSSATDAMEQTIRRLVKEHSFHFTSGNFSEKFYDMARDMGKNALQDKAEWGEINDFQNTDIPEDAELITITYNETSTGAMCQAEDIRHIRNAHPEKLLAIDVTSVAGVMPFNISDADVWLFSVQKGFGLPSGLGIWILSPRAKEVGLRLEENMHIPVGAFPLAAQIAKMEKNYQTIQTPNIFNIYLLGKQLARWNARGGVEVFHREAGEKKALMDEFLASHDELSHFIKDEKARSLSTFCLQADPEVIQRLHAKATERNITLGGGYGKVKADTIRIANFPSVSKEDLRQLLSVL